MNRYLLSLFLNFVIIVQTSCAELRLTPRPEPVVVLPTATATTMPTISPTATPMPAVIPTPAKVGRWECDPSGGIACYESLFEVAMLNAEEGWAAGFQGMLLHYTRQPGNATPNWQYVKPLNTGTFNALFPLSPNELWAVQNYSIILHYQDGIWKEFGAPAERVFDLDMLNSEEGWAVGFGGVLLHYTQAPAEWQRVTSPTEKSLIAIDMLNSEEGWAVGMAGTILHYLKGKWEPMSLSFTGDQPPDFTDIEMINAKEGWAAADTPGNAIFHYHDGKKYPTPEVLRSSAWVARMRAGR